MSLAYSLDLKSFADKVIQKVLGVIVGLGAQCCVNCAIVDLLAYRFKSVEQAGPRRSDLYIVQGELTVELGQNALVFPKRLLLSCYILKMVLLRFGRKFGGIYRAQPFAILISLIGDVILKI